MSTMLLLFSFLAHTHPELLNTTIPWLSPCVDEPSIGFLLALAYGQITDYGVSKNLQKRGFSPYLTAKLEKAHIKIIFGNYWITSALCLIITLFF